MALSPLGISTAIPKATMAYLHTPKLSFTEEQCLTFMLFTRAPLQLLMSNDTGDEVILSIMASLGKAWHKLSMDIPAGDRHIVFAVNRGNAEVMWGNGPFNLFLAAVDDILFTQGNCSSSQGYCLLKSVKEIYFSCNKYIVSHE